MDTVAQTQMVIQARLPLLYTQLADHGCLDENPIGHPDREVSACVRQLVVSHNGKVTVTFQQFGAHVLSGGYRPFGIEGWRVVFLTVGIVSFALGILNYFFAHDPRYAQDNKSVLKEHQHSMSFRGALAEMKRIVVIPSFAIIILQVSAYSMLCAQSIAMCT